MRRAQWLPATGVAAFVGFALGCGAGASVAPKREAVSVGPECRGFEALAPKLLDYMKSDRVGPLKDVVQAALLRPEREGEPSPISDVLRALFSFLNGLLQAKAEPGALAGTRCAEVPPPVAASNGLCEVRRATQLLVHEGSGKAALSVLQPQLDGLLAYVVGRGVDKKPHYEVAHALGRFCGQDAVCQLGDGIDLVQSVQVYLKTAEGKDAVAHVQALLDKPSLSTFFAGTLAEDDAVALVQVLLKAIIGAKPDSLDNLPLPADLQQDVKPVIADLKRLFDPSHTPDVMTPLRKALNCIDKADNQSELVRMLYRLIFRDRVAAFQFAAMKDALAQFEKADPRQTLMHLVDMLLGAVRKDTQAIDAAALICRRLMSPVPSAGQTRSTPEQVLPIVADLLKNQTLPELLCAADTLVFGCSGPQPACASP